jgi:hypothetical protein
MEQTLPDLAVVMFQEVRRKKNFAQTATDYIYIYMRQSSGNPNSSILDSDRQLHDRPRALFCHLRLAALSFPPRKNFQAFYYFNFCFALLKVYV